MSDILIKDMEMPKNCGECPMGSVFAGYICFAKNKQFVKYPLNSIQDFCPLVPVPPHGRLIDASEKIKVQIYDDMTEDYHMVDMTIDDLLSQGWIEANTPTIIEAEEGE